MKTAGLALIAAAGMAASANATFFSFASDTADRQWTFTGAGNQVRQGDAAGVNIDLIVNNDNGGMDAVYHTKFMADWTLAYEKSSAVGSIITHQYRASGVFQWLDARSGDLLLSCAFENAVFSAAGKVAAWSSTATVMGTDELSVVQYTSGIDNADLGIAAGAMSGPQDFAFTMTVINTSGALPYTPNAANRGVSIGADMLPNRQWFAEGSYSGSAVPTPGSAALLGLGGLALGKRRRA
ncbi:MAG: hypothetical protein AABZ53_05250 [Planctomycetota bacterium]